MPRLSISRDDSASALSAGLRRTFKRKKPKSAAQSDRAELFRAGLRSKKKRKAAKKKRRQSMSNDAVERRERAKIHGY